MSNLEAEVRTVVDSFIMSGILFTALDVSVEVKKTNPFARHSEVRDIVRGNFAEMQKLGYGRTPIQVTLADGSQVDALLYHSLADSWDLDSKYDQFKRSQAAPVVPVTPVAVPVVTAPVIPAKPLTIGDLIKQHLKPGTSVNKPVTAPVVASPPANATDPKQLWANLFGGVKLFPRQ